MRKSKYLILNNFYFNFNNDLTDIEYVKESFKNQNILDLFRFDKIKSITKYKFNGYNINFVYLPKNIEKIEYCAFYKNQIQILNLSNCKNLKIINEGSFFENKIKYLKLPKNIEKIEWSAFVYNQIEILDLSNCIKLKNIEKHAFEENPLQEIKILDNINVGTSYSPSFETDKWNTFTKYYNDNNKKEGDYKLENNKWQWYPL